MLLASLPGSVESAAEDLAWSPGDWDSADGLGGCCSAEEGTASEDHFGMSRDGLCGVKS